ncbi:hypothetical protein BB559_007288 [Furculomyces boomerangus]|uniref:Uncharacterized protein n=2 Tax=Harpellales TaxID=61421 RepID=A0A2T9XXX2_9FUNG|nr:hypothetical protein BB559_007288 [Furculomyces boomerangus]PVZ97611.1 hypothetical protein BB558_006414 [Smittium angustum]
MQTITLDYPNTKNNLKRSLLHENGNDNAPSHKKHRQHLSNDEIETQPQFYINTQNFNQQINPPQVLHVLPAKNEIPIPSSVSINNKLYKKYSAEFPKESPNQTLQSNFELSLENAKSISFPHSLISKSDGSNSATNSKLMGINITQLCPNTGALVLYKKPLIDSELLEPLQEPKDEVLESESTNSQDDYEPMDIDD